MTSCFQAEKNESIVESFCSDSGSAVYEPIEHHSDARSSRPTRTSAAQFNAESVLESFASESSYRVSELKNRITEANVRWNIADDGPEEKTQNFNLEPLIQLLKEQSEEIQNYKLVVSDLSEANANLRTQLTDENTNKQKEIEALKTVLSEQSATITGLRLQLNGSEGESELKSYPSGSSSNIYKPTDHTSVENEKIDGQSILHSANTGPLVSLLREQIDENKNLIHKLSDLEAANAELRMKLRRRKSL